MTRTYLAVFERGKECWSAWAPDVPNTGGMGDTVQDARKSLLTGISDAFEFALEKGLPVPEATTTSVDFAEFEGNSPDSHFEIEWLTVELPDSHHNQERRAA